MTPKSFVLISAWYFFLKIKNLFKNIQNLFQICTVEPSWTRGRCLWFRRWWQRFLNVSRFSRISENGSRGGPICDIQTWSIYLCWVGFWWSSQVRSFSLKKKKKSSLITEYNHLVKKKSTVWKIGNHILYFFIKTRSYCDHVFPWNQLFINFFSTYFKPLISRKNIDLP